jgi:carboxymethylenebutenolidase
LGEQVRLKASDGFEAGGYLAPAAGAPKGGIAVIQEIFGVNTHIRAVCDRLAAAGYDACAPAIFDRQQRDFTAGYTPTDVARGRAFLQKFDWDACLRDVEAALDAVGRAGRRGVVGFCLGGSVAFAAATRLNGLSACVGYYGGRIKDFADETPRCPVQLHFGALDQGIPLADVETVKRKRPDVEVFIYEGAGHGFNCDERAAYHATSAALAWRRTLAFFDKHLAKDG